MKLGLVTFALLCGASGGALADPERDRIGTDRATANAKLAEQQRECATRFIVAACLDDARTEHRDALKRLRQQELQLDEAKRRAAVEGRRKAIAEKAQPAQARASDALPDAPKVQMRRERPAASEPAARLDDSPTPRTPRAAASDPSRSEVEQREQWEQQQFEARRREAQAHRDAVAQRNALRAARGKVAAPLPVPSAPR